ncbi:hypothetical protein O1L68_40455 [Streptomyces lydicus]|nr:hypothetical protein [Streptomyces lydicus]
MSTRAGEPSSTPPTKTTAWTEVYQSTNSDLPRDTALVAAAIQDAIAGRRAS